MNRYERHKPLYNQQEFAAIRNAKIAVAGCGGLGSTVLQLLARIGFGSVHFWDDGRVDAPDLNRQLLYKTKHLGQYKTDAALSELKEINPDINFYAHKERLESQTAVPELDLVIDCLDSFASRLSLDALFFSKGVPLIHGSVYKEMGQITSLFPGKTENYQLTFGIENQPEEEQNKTIFPAIVTTVASLQVNEAVKCITKKYDQMLLNKLLIVNLSKNKFDLFPLT